MSQALLEVSHLKKGFDGTEVIRDLSLTLAEGEIKVVIGPSGCGKSTLLRCINGLESVDGGQILLSGEPIQNRAKDMHLIRQKIGMVFQSYDLFPHLTVMQNLLLGPTKVRRQPRTLVEDEAQTWLQRIGLAEKAESFPRQLSGGQKQRVALVRAMLMHPQILLLDEITAALDPEMVHEVLGVVLDLANDGVTMLIVTHEMRFAEAVADEILFLEDGYIVEQSSPDVFFHHPQTQRASAFLHTFDFVAPKKHVQNNQSA